MANQMRVQGADTLNATLRIAGSRLGNMAAASARAAAQVAQDARSRAPRRTGRLAGSVAPKSQGNRAQVAATAPYGIFVEYGTRFNSAQPFMRPALTAQTQPTVDTYATEVQQIMNQVKGA
jgi:HK97 gp10 family phage protein